MTLVLVWLILALIMCGVVVFLGAYEEAEFDRILISAIFIGFMWPLAIVCAPFAGIYFLGKWAGKVHRERRSKKDWP